MPVPGEHGASAPGYGLIELFGCEWDSGAWHCPGLVVVVGKQTLYVDHAATVSAAVAPLRYACFFTPI